MKEIFAVFEGNLMSFDDAVSALKKDCGNRYSGIAFSIIEPYAFIKLVRVKNQLIPQTRDIIRKLDSYTERDPYNNITIVVKTENNKISINTTLIKIYSKRGICIPLTGNVFYGKTVINERTSELESVIKDYHLIKYSNIGLV